MEDDDRQNHGTGGDMVIEEKARRTVRHNFDEVERLVLGADLAAALDERDAAESRLTEVKAAGKAEIEANAAAARLLQRKIANGYEMREEMCVLVRDYAAFRVTLTVIDTGEVIEDRAMTPSERETLPIEAPPTMGYAADTEGESG